MPLEECNLSVDINKFPQATFKGHEFTKRTTSSPFLPTHGEISHHEQDLIEKTHYRINST
jgi:hypothetical protein